MSTETALFAVPLPVSRLVFMPTGRTLARCASFGASEARHVSLGAFVSQVVNIFAIFPQTHTLVVVSSVITVSHTMRITDEERANLVLNTEVDNLACGLMSLIADPSFSTFALCVFRVL